MHKLSLTICSFIALFTWSAGSSRSHGDFVVDISSVTMGPRGTSFVDVVVRSFDGTPLNLAGFDVRFTIQDVSPVGQPASGELFFHDSFSASAPTDALRQSNSEQGLPGYVFAGRSSPDNFYANRLNPSIGSLAGGDSTFNPSTGNYTNVTVTSPLLLARLEIGQRQSIDTELARGTYEIRLDAGASRFYNADDVTQLFRIGQVGQVGIVAVPEPSMWSMLIVVTLARLPGRRLRLKSLGH
ncbi:MAG: hypothetical protein IT423_19610 [Pirellulaceae bacterium]|nr:hypothetical protein [Pirellulaceae bacterium]